MFSSGFRWRVKASLISLRPSKSTSTSTTCSLSPSLNSISGKKKTTQTQQSSLKRQFVNQTKAEDDQCAKLFCFRCVQIPHWLADKRIYRQKTFAGFHYLHYGRGGQAFLRDKRHGFASRMRRAQEISGRIRNSMKRCSKRLGNCPCLNGELNGVI